jgi:hypothetical protein
MMRGSRSARLSAQRGLRERGVLHRSTLFFYFIRSKAGVEGALASAFGTLLGNGAGIPDLDDEHGDEVAPSLNAVAMRGVLFSLATRVPPSPEHFAA